MRTTVDLDSQTYRLLKAIAEQKGSSFGKVVAEAVQGYYGQARDSSVNLGVSPAGFPTLTVGRLLTPEDVRELEDE